MDYFLDFSPQAQQDIALLKTSGNKNALKKLLVLLEELAQHPATGTGKPEALKHELAGCWSRRINSEHRIIYEIDNDRVLIHSMVGHYKKGR